MDKDEHRRWLAQLAAADRARRAEAEPEIARKEALLARERARLTAAEAARADLERELDAARRDMDAPDADG